MKAVVFLAALSLNQNDPSFALEVVSTSHGSITVKCIKLIALARTGHFHKALNILKYSIQNRELMGQGRFPQDVVSTISYLLNVYPIYNTILSFVILLSLQLVKFEKEIRTNGSQYLNDYNEIVNDLCRLKMIANKDEVNYSNM